MATAEARPVAAPAIAIDIAIAAGDWGDAESLEALAGRAVEATLAHLAHPPEDAELSLLFTDDGQIRDLNHRYRGKDRATNVLSFPAAPIADQNGPLLGDIVLARGTIAREAAAGGLKFADHLTHLIVHGLLHLLGYDHEDEGEARVMEGLESAILAGLGIADPYADGGEEEGAGRTLTKR